ncbi:MAG: ester cyclase [Flammeovirgaceae bacterium]|nr:ester cyclase [Flammeovirgaceae bacterium]
MGNLKEQVYKLNELIKQYKFDEALNKFYNDEVITLENETRPTIGLPAYREAAKRYIENVSNYSAELKSVIVSDNMSVCEWHYRFDHKQWGKWDCIQLSLQRWKDGKIVHEWHHYGALS